VLAFPGIAAFLAVLIDWLCEVHPGANPQLGME